MNPFVLPGPSFLVFYALFASVILLASYLVRRFNESGSLPNLDLRDPYLFACLSGGPAQVARVAALALTDRGLLQVSGDSLERSHGVQVGFGKSRVERELLDYFRNAATLEQALQAQRVRAIAGAEYEDVLRSHRLIPDAAAQRLRQGLVTAAILVLLGVGGLKLTIALSAGRSNVLFLIAMTIIACIAAVKIGSPYRTSLGNAYLGSLRTLFSGLRGRAS